MIHQLAIFYGGRALAAAATRRANASKDAKGGEG
jgi:hypothetical protein